MPIKARIDMLSTGIRTPIGIKVFGKDLGEMEKLAQGRSRPVVKACRARPLALAERGDRRQVPQHRARPRSWPCRYG